MFILVILSGLALLLPTLKLGFSGDDYMALHDYFYNPQGGSTAANWFNPKFFLTQYGPQDTLMGLIYRIFGLNYPIYFFSSMCLRLLAAGAIYKCTKVITGNNKAATLAGIFFAVSFTGLESTSWVFNMGSYLAIAIFSFFLIAYFGYLRKLTLKLFVFANILFTATVVAMPIRMSFLPLAVGSVELVWLFKHRSLRSLISSIFRLAIFASLIFTILLSGNSLGNGTSLTEKINYTVSGRVGSPEKSIVDLLRSGKPGYLGYPVAQIGAVIFPEELVNSWSQQNTVVSAISLTISAFIVFCIMLEVFIKSGLLTKKLAAYTFVTGSGWCISVTLISRQLLVYFGTRAAFYWLVIGGLVLCSAVALCIHHRHQRNIIFASMALATTVFGYLVAWIRFPLDIDLTYHRYLIPSSAGLALILGSIVTIANQNRTSRPLILLVIGISLVHFLSARHYLNVLLANRNAKLTTAISTSLPNIAQLTNNSAKDHPLVFYFQSDNYDVLYHTILFGFPAIVAINQNIVNVPNLVYTDNWSEIISDVQDGNGLQRFSWPIKPVPLSNVFSYKIVSGSYMIDTTEETRSQLAQYTPK